MVVEKPVFTGLESFQVCSNKVHAWLQDQTYSEATLSNCS